MSSEAFAAAVPAMLGNPRAFVLTSDIDWASEHCIEDLLGFCAACGIKPTLFATHDSQALRRAGQTGAAEIGVHPNFLPGSTHGSDISSIVDHVCRLYPQAQCFRSHSFMDGTPIAEAFRQRGFKYDSNLLTYLEENLGPIRHASGLLRFPVFWSDGVHWSQPGTSWDVDSYYDFFLSPGLKIISFHPIHFTLNTPSGEFYRAVRGEAAKSPGAEIERLRHQGKGVRTFASELIERLRRAGCEFHTLHDLHRQFASRAQWDAGRDTGRTSVVTRDLHRTYWQQSERERQETLRKQYDQRNATDPYATSRDYNQRELEISAVLRALDGEPAGRLVDFGCGNGYTLLSLAKQLPAWQFEGIDFSQKMIDGAAALREEANGQLQSHVTFECADAVSRIAGLDAGSVDAILTERFLLNLPSGDAQRAFIAEILRALRPGGVFLMCEGSMEGFRGLNRLRTAVGLEAIAETGTNNLSAIRFEDRDIEAFVADIGFALEQKHGFSHFFAMSRALHPALIHPQPPKFKSKINDLARHLQMELPFAPGVGSNVLWVLRKKPAAPGNAAP